MTIVPDTKDWTWVLQRACPECGFDAQAVRRDQIGAQIIDSAAVFRAVLASESARTRPRADVWSPLEYACHVRDVCRIYAQRLELMRDQDNPTFPNWDQDATAVADRYTEQSPSAVSDELVLAAAALAAGFDTITQEQWLRRGTRSDAAVFTIESLGRYLLHDLVHHVYDITGHGVAR